MSAIDVAAAVLLLAGAAFVLLAGLGLWRFEDLYSRIHAATKAITLGVILVIAAAALRVETTGDVLKLLLAALLQVISAPVAGHMLGRAAHAARKQLPAGLTMDHLREDEERVRAGGYPKRRS